MKKKHTLLAIDDIRAANEGFISGSKAARYARRLQEIEDRLLEYPNIGAPDDYPDVRKVPFGIADLPYTVRYRVVGDVLEILRVWDERRDPASMDLDL